MEAEKARKARERELLIEIAEKTATALQTGSDVIVSDDFHYTPYVGLSLEERRIEVKFAAELAADLEAASTEYKRRFDNVLDRNNVQELSPDYAATRESRQQWSVATLEPAGAFVDWLFAKVLSKAEPKDTILFNAGGQGSGKTTATADIKVTGNAILVMDGTLQNHARSVEHFRSAFAAGCSIELRFVYCNWPDAVCNMAKRAAKGAGRVVPLKRAAKGHFEAARTTLKLCGEFADKPELDVFVVENRIGELPRSLNLAWLAGHLHNSVEELLQTGQTTLQDEFKLHSDDPDYSARLLAQFQATPQPGSGGAVSSDRGGNPGSSQPGIGSGRTSDGEACGGSSSTSLTAADLIPAEAAKQGGGKIIMATVKGDVHDIGKNIVGVVLACNGFEVTDLGVMVPCDKILAAAIEKGADVIGLSGLITPSLDEMAHVASEMERRGMKIPLLIGGATTSPAHTAIKIAPHYSGPIVHVLDASRSVPVTTSLISDENRDAYIAENEARHIRLREEYGKKKERKLLSIAESREKAFKCDWSTQEIAKPSFIGTKVHEGADMVATLRPYIDWSPFFHSWELRGRWITAEGRFSSSHEDAEMKVKAEEEAVKLFKSANDLLDRVIAEKRFNPRGVFGFFPANSIGDDIEVYAEDGSVRCTFHTLRQQVIKKDTPNYALSDYIAPKNNGRADYIGGFVVGIHGADDFAHEFEKAHDPFSAIIVKALADRLAEAFAEYLHKQARVAWGYENPEDFTNEDLVKERYRGIRPAPGYPSQPDHTEKPILFDLLDASAKTGVELTESMAMHPGSAVSGLYFSHPDVHYFGISVLAKDQVEDYAKRKGMTLAEAEKWLGPWLGY
ncbi:vitamin B12 dependent-methionine synthase activation domain-containing protein [Prosthecobacter sp.]|uniref:vitamin B12 dependent-methionine synthase activation domain-containing protein n=1 Tax=Prosthecobacter sp. TaxID=1965333 RepID=UPI0031F32CB4